MQFAPEKCIKIIIGSCFRLHNKAIEAKIPLNAADPVELFRTMLFIKVYKTMNWLCDRAETCSEVLKPGSLLCMYTLCLYSILKYPGTNSEENRQTDIQYLELGIEFFFFLIYIWVIFIDCFNMDVVLLFFYTIYIFKKTWSYIKL